MEKFHYPIYSEESENDKVPDNWEDICDDDSVGDAQETVAPIGDAQETAAPIGDIQETGFTIGMSRRQEKLMKHPKKVKKPSKKEQ